MTETTNEPIVETPSQRRKGVFYTCSIDTPLYDRLQNHLLALKGIEGKATKQSWLCQAISEKINKENPSEIPKESRLHFSIDSDSLNEIEKRVNFCRKFLTSYSRKQWIVEAIYEKLQRDGKAVQDAIEKIKAGV